MDTKLLQNTKIYLLISFFASLEFALPIYILFGKNYLGLTYAQVGLLTLVMYATGMGFDFIFGVIADSFSRKRIYLIGMLLAVISVLPYLLTRSYIFFVVAAILAGLSIALTSNILDTVVYNNLADLDQLERYPLITSKSQQVLFLGRACASIVGGLLFSFDPRFPYVAYLAALIICILLGIRMHEDKRVYQKSDFAKAGGAILTFLSKKKDVLYFCGVMMVSLFFACLLFGYYQPYFNILKINPVLLGFLYSAISLVSAYGAHIMKKMLHTRSSKAINTYIIVGVITTALIMVTKVTWASLLGPLALALVSGFMAPNLRYFLNSRSPSEIKTSIASFGTTFYNLGGSIGLFSAGVLADRFSSFIIFSIIIAGSLFVLLLNSFTNTQVN